MSVGVARVASFALEPAISFTPLGSPRRLFLSESRARRKSCDADAYPDSLSPSPASAASSSPPTRGTPTALRRRLSSVLRSSRSPMSPSRRRTSSSRTAISTRPAGRLSSSGSASAEGPCTTLSSSPTLRAVGLRPLASTLGSLALPQAVSLSAPRSVGGALARSSRTRTRTTWSRRSRLSSPRSAGLSRHSLLEPRAAVVRVPSTASGRSA